MRLLSVDRPGLHRLQVPLFFPSRRRGEGRTKVLESVSEKPAEALETEFRCFTLTLPSQVLQVSGNIL